MKKTFNRFDPDCVRVEYPKHQERLRAGSLSIEDLGPRERSFMDAWLSDDELVGMYGPQALYDATPSNDCDAFEFMQRNRRRVSV